MPLRPGHAPQRNLGPAGLLQPMGVNHAHRIIDANMFRVMPGKHISSNGPIDFGIKFSYEAEEPSGGSEDQQE